MKNTIWMLLSVGHVTDDKMLRLLHKGEVVAEVPADALAEEAPVYHKPSSVPAYFTEYPSNGKCRTSSS